MLRLNAAIKISALFVLISAQILLSLAQSTPSSGKTGCGQFSRIYTHNMTAKTKEDNKAGSRIKTFDLGLVEAPYEREYAIWIESADGGSTLTQFRLDRISNKLHLIQLQEFDYEDPDQPKVIELSLICREVATSARIEMDLKVIVDDVNDHSPEFMNLPNTVYVNELSPLFTPIYTISAADQDINDNGKIFYSIQPEDSVFTIQNSALGRIYLKEPLDYDGDQTKIYNISITAENTAATPRLKTTSHLVIHVQDGDDLSPKFERRVVEASTFEIAGKEGRELDPAVKIEGVNITAHDEDTGINQTVQYSILNDTEHADYFTIDPTSAALFLARSLDREVTSSVQLLIKAEQTDDDQRFDICLVRVTLLDINDHPPAATFRKHTVSLLENSPPGTIVATVHTSDLDGDDEFTYDISPGGIFAVDDSTGEISVADGGQLDREQLSNITLQITARERNTPELRQSSPVELTILLVDDNDNSPVFTYNFYASSVIENSPVGSFVLKVRADDADTSEKFNNVTYWIVDDGDDVPFDVTSAGDVITADVIDRETQASYRFIVRASDLGGRSDKCMVEVRVDDVNDNPPDVTSREDDVIVSECAAVGTLVAIVQASDRDVNDTLAFSITSPVDDVIPFYVDDAGRIVTSDVLDREMTLSYDVVVAVTDGNHTTNHKLMIKVSGVNDNAPTFTHSNFTFQLDPDLNRTVGFVQASDPDEEENAEFRYQFCLDENSFTIDEATGLIRASPDLDFRGKSTSFRLCVVARDVDVMTSLPVPVDVELRRADFRPEIDRSRLVEVYHVVEGRNRSQPVVRIQMVNAEGANIGYRVTSSSDPNVTSSDPNVTSSDPNMTSSDASMFAIDDATGEVRVAGELDADESRDRYHVTVYAFDRDRPAREDRVDFTVVVDDVNDIPPSFKRDSYHVTTPEDTPVGSVVFTLAPHDGDRDPRNREFVFTLLNAAPSGAFRVEPSSGEIRTTRELDFDPPVNHRAFNLTVGVENARPLARDDHVTAVNSTVVVTVQIADVNDHAPAFSPIDDDVTHVGGVAVLSRGAALYDVTVPESVGMGGIGVRLTADDVDTGRMGEVEYFLNGSDYFTVNRLTGELYLAKDLDYEAGPRQHWMTVTAQDGGVPPMKSEASIHVHVGNVNDNPPVCTETAYYYKVFVTGSGSYDAGFVACTDKDGDNLKFSIQPTPAPPGGGEVAIDPSNGRLTITNYDVTSVVTYKIDVDDDGDQVTHVTRVLVTLDVRRVRELRRRGFERAEKKVDVDEDHVVGEAVAELTPPANTTCYLLDPTNTFDIIPQDGKILLRKELDYEDVRVYTMCVEARDSVNATVATASLVIQVIDVNDNAPVFSRHHYTAEVDENSTDGLLVLTVSATDADVTSQLRYEMEETSYLRMDEKSGEIFTTTQQFDRELGDERNFTVSCTDGVHTSDVIVTVTIRDVNDNVPRFFSSEDRVNVASQYMDDDEEVIYRARAYDPDFGVNGTSLYSLKNRHDRLFRIDELSGEVRMRRTKYARSYRLVIQVRDFGASLIDNSVLPDPDDVMVLHVMNKYLDVTVGPTSSSIPVRFRQDVYTVNLQNPAPAGVVLETLEVTNRSALLVYYVSSAPSAVPFAIPDPRVGNVVATQLLRHTAFYEFTVQVEDSCTGKVYDRTSVRVNLSINLTSESRDHDYVGIPFDARIGYRFKLKDCGENLTEIQPSEGAEKHFTLSRDHTCEVLVASSLTPVASRSLQLRMSTASSETTRLRIYVVGEENMVRIRLNHTTHHLHLADVMKSVRRCYGNVEAPLDVIHALPRGGGVELTVYAHNEDDHQLLPADQLAGELTEKCMKREKGQNQLFPLRVVSIQSAASSSSRDSPTHHSAMTTAVTSLAVVSSVLLLTFFVFVVVYFVTRERKMHESGDILPLSCKSAQLPHKLYLRNPLDSASGGENPACDVTDDVSDHDFAAKRSTLPATNSFVPKKKQRPPANPDGSGEKPPPSQLVRATGDGGEVPDVISDLVTSSSGHQPTPNPRQKSFSLATVL